MFDLDAVTDAYRLINSDGDGLSGLTIDRYGDTLLCELYSLGIAQRLGILNRNENRFEPAQMLISLNNCLTSCFAQDDLEKRRLIMKTVGSNLVLRDKKLSIDARKPFRRWSSASSFSEMRAYLEDIRTFVTEQSTEANEMLAMIRQLSKELRSSHPN